MGSMTYRILRKSGRTRSGFDPFWHAVPDPKGRALCGNKPNVQWTTQESLTITCPRCRRMLKTIGGKVIPPMPPKGRS
jgi:hypothetical protein